MPSLFCHEGGRCKNAQAYCGVAKYRYDLPSSPTLLPMEKRARSLVPSPKRRGLGCSLLPEGWAVRQFMT